LNRSIRWFVIGIATLVAIVSTWAFLVNLLGPLFVPWLEFDGTGSQPGDAPRWNFFAPYSQWEPEQPSSSHTSPPEPALPPWWYITARTPNPYWTLWLAGPLGTFGFGALSLLALGILVWVGRLPQKEVKG